VSKDQSETLWWVLARTCNLACDYCYQGGNHSAQRVHSLGLKTLMSKAVLDQALPWAIEWTTRRLKISLYGGEPLLNWPLVRQAVPEWKEAFAAAGKEVTFGATTNGTLLKPEVREFFDAHDIGVLLSLDGPQERHDSSRPKVGGGPSWQDVDPVALLAWRPHLEIAWQLDPRHYFDPDDIDRMLELGFKRQNYNLNWLEPWPAEARLRLMEFGKRAARRMAQGKLLSYWQGKYDKAGTGQRMQQPCGLGTRMLALTPEGLLYPSQEMAFTAFEPERAPGTAEHYCVGDVAKTPVLDAEALRRVGQIQTKDMRPPPPFDCSDCVAEAASIGGCHCRYIGQDGIDPANRYDVPEGYCQSQRAMITGMMQGFWVEKKLRPARLEPAAVPVKLERRPIAQIPDVVHIKVGR
jgi:sulfatase maturation enzyme AslB (radical SAM superfamily)